MKCKSGFVLSVRGELSLGTLCHRFLLDGIENAGVGSGCVCASSATGRFCAGRSAANSVMPHSSARRASILISSLASPTSRQGGSTATATSAARLPAADSGSAVYRATATPRPVRSPATRKIRFMWCSRASPAQDGFGERRRPAEEAGVQRLRIRSADRLGQLRRVRRQDRTHADATSVGEPERGLVAVRIAGRRFAGRAPSPHTPTLPHARPHPHRPAHRQVMGTRLVFAPPAFGRRTVTPRR